MCLSYAILYQLTSYQYDNYQPLPQNQFAMYLLLVN